MLSLEKINERLLNRGVMALRWRGKDVITTFTCISCETIWREEAILVVYKGNKCPECFPRLSIHSKEISVLSGPKLRELNRLEAPQVFSHFGIKAPLPA